ncbi:M20 family metallopeptidase [Lactonifactor longoviformis]|uniref:M20 family metallopeptidase n=1 Tax=Lactonifactor TaxID=420345 RepID=UPI0012B0B23C|nr:MULTISPECIES: M20 family metallopeptidase [Lactonifactor]MCQ4672165.1 M20 family metallopeptidase [Lactonifactor longoviformis]MRZ99722.1 ArgE/DapE family deacylase [Lactonifactor sp. BIOML-A5]MSA08183.1 ArgE/DapE family deacylase [Lactonifactor sp. BIOML-A4]MSA11815.1 ArgE/DapE family deacylase [Lactonifactor sp. BIOML-A3]MSA15294.1 ArgE/DapE family deacylase [Lactonifactor sp. BIOML-A2]
MEHRERMDVAELTRELVKIDSTNPGEQEGNIGEYITWFLRNTGAEATATEVLPGRYNLRMRLPGQEETPQLVYICHMDTVVIGEGWTADPLGGELQNDRIYGRGACDMKGGMACAISAFKYIADKQTALRHPFSLIFTVDEEENMKGAEAVVEAGWVDRESWVLDMEPTNGEIQAAHKGRLWMEILAEGITAHASTPWKGADAVAAMAEFTASLRKQINVCPVHGYLGPSTVTFGQIQGGYRPYVVPDRCRMWVDMRLSPPIDRKAAVSMVEESVKKAEKEVPGARVSYKVTGDRPYIEMEEQSALLKTLREVCSEKTGAPAKVTAFPGYTDTAVIAGMTGGCNCMSYGPGSLEMAHKPDEYVPCADLYRCEGVLKALAEKILL